MRTPEGQAAWGWLLGEGEARGIALVFVLTSLVGIAAVMEEEIADILVKASHGEAPTEVHLSGRVRFDKDGRISRV